MISLLFYLYLHTNMQILNKHRPADRKKKDFILSYFLTKHQYTATHTVCLTFGNAFGCSNDVTLFSVSSRLNLSHSDIYLTKHNMDFGILQDKP